MENKSLIERISRALCIPLLNVQEYAMPSAKRKRDFYRVAYIPKKHNPNALRKIYLPSAEIKAIQHYLVEAYISRLPVHESAKAYIRGGNTIDNAMVHRDNRHFLLLDIKDFFDSMDKGLFQAILKAGFPSLSEEDLNVMTNLCSYQDKFVQGCVSSPAIANAYLFEFDIAMDALAKSLPKGKYTRYSDDMVFSSSQKIPGDLPEKVAAKLRKYKLNLNPRKTRFISNLDRLRITGIRVRKDESLGLNTTFKKELKNEIYQFCKKAKTGRATMAERQHLLGKLAYLSMADPAYYNSIIVKYKQDEMLLDKYVRQVDFTSQKVRLDLISETTKDVYSAAKGNSFFCYVGTDEPSESYPFSTMIGLILYEGMHEAVQAEIQDGSQDNLFLPIAYFRFKSDSRIFPNRVYVATKDITNSKSILSTEDVFPCAFLASLWDSSIRFLSFRDPIGEEKEIAKALADEWKRLENDE